MSALSVHTVRTVELWWARCPSRGSAGRVCELPSKQRVRRHHHCLRTLKGHTDVVEVLTAAGAQEVVRAALWEPVQGFYRFGDWRAHVTNYADLDANKSFI